MILVSTDIKTSGLLQHVVKLKKETWKTSGKRLLEIWDATQKICHIDPMLLQSRTKLATLAQHSINIWSTSFVSWGRTAAAPSMTWETYDLTKQLLVQYKSIELLPENTHDMLGCVVKCSRLIAHCWDECAIVFVLILIHFNMIKWDSSLTNVSETVWIHFD